MTSPLVPALASGGLVGFSLGLVGGGGSILATPLLPYVAGVASPHVAIGTSALAVSINAYANLLVHARKGMGAGSARPSSPRRARLARATVRV